MCANWKETITTSCIGLGRAERFLQFLCRGNVEFLGRGHDHYHRKLYRRRPQTLINPLYGLGLLAWFSCPGNAGAWEPGQPQETGGSHAAVPQGRQERFRVSPGRAWSVSEPSGNVPERARKPKKLPGNCLNPLSTKTYYLLYFSNFLLLHKNRKNTIVSLFSTAKRRPDFRKSVAGQVTAMTVFAISKRRD